MSERAGGAAAQSRWRPAGTRDDAPRGSPAHGQKYAKVIKTEEKGVVRYYDTPVRDSRRRR